MSALYSKTGIYFLALFAYCLVWATILHIFPQKDTVWNYLYNAVYSLIFFSGAFIGFKSGLSIGMKNSMGKALLFLSTGFLAWGIGLIIWLYYNLNLDIEVPYPSIADWFFVIMYPTFAISCVYLLRPFIPFLTKRFILEATLIVFFSFIAVFLFFLQPDISGDVPFLANVINILYSTGDALLIAITFLTIRICGGKIQSSMVFLLIGFLFEAIADFVYGYRSSAEIYWNGDISDILYTIAAFMMSVGIVAIRDSLKTPAAAINTTYSSFTASADGEAISPKRIGSDTFSRT